MKVSFEELVNNSRGDNSDWLLSEIMSSLTDEHLKSKDLSIPENRQWEVKLLIDGIECEPQLLGRILSNLEDTIRKQAMSVIQERLEEIESDMSTLQESYIDKVRDLISGVSLEEMQKIED